MKKILTELANIIFPSESKPNITLTVIFLLILFAAVIFSIIW